MNSNFRKPYLSTINTVNVSTIVISVPAHIGILIQYRNSKKLKLNLKLKKFIFKRLRFVRQNVQCDGSANNFLHVSAYD